MSKRPKHGGLKAPEPLLEAEDTVTGLSDRSLLRSMAADEDTLEAAARKASAVLGKMVDPYFVQIQLDALADFVQSTDIREEDQ